MSTENYVDGPLRLEEIDDVDITIHWLGRSMAREPGLFVLPILTRAMEHAQRSNKRLVLDFRRLEYLNSSTITPVVRVLEQAKRGSVRCTVRFDSQSKWQSLAFSALFLFTTPDGRVSIERG